MRMCSWFRWAIRIVCFFGCLSWGEAQTYQVRIEVEDVWWESPENFGAFLKAVIDSNGISIPPSNDYFYQWYVYFSHEGYWRLLSGGFGVDEASPETLPGESILTYVVVSDSVNHAFEGIQSPVAGPFTMPGSGGWPVSFRPLDHNGNDFSSHVTPRHWRYTLDRWKDGYRGFLTLDHDEVIQASPGFVAPLQEKRHFWDQDPAIIRNYRIISVDRNLHELVVQYDSSYGGITLIAELLSSGGVEDSIDFKDPWLVDTTDSRFYTPPYGYHNLGMDAPFKRYPTPLNLTLTSPFKGVFLNQIPDPNNPDIPYYSVRAVDNQQVTINGKTVTYDWESWSYNPNSISLQYPNSRTTAVVFKQDGATLTANLKGRRVSNTPRATFANNGRKLSHRWGAGFAQKPVLVYTDRGHVFKAYQDDGGLWQKDIRVATAGSNETLLHPSIAYLHDMSGIVPGNTHEVSWESFSAGVYVPQCTRCGAWSYGSDVGPTHPSVAGYRYVDSQTGQDVYRFALAFRGRRVVESGGVEGIQVHFESTDGSVSVLKSLRQEASADFPSLDNRKYDSGSSNAPPYYMLVWQESGGSSPGIHYREFYLDAQSNLQVMQSCLLTANLANYFAHAYPSVHVSGPYPDQERVFVVWQGMERFSPGESVTSTEGCPPAGKNEVPVVLLWQKGSQCNSGATLVAFRLSSTCDRLPVVSSRSASGGQEVRLVFQDGSTVVKTVKRTSSGVWSDPLTLSSDGAYPALATVGSGFQAIWTEQGSSPYRVMHTTSFPDGADASGTLVHSRQVIFRLKQSLAGGPLLPFDAQVVLEVGDPLLESGAGSQLLSPEPLVGDSSMLVYGPVVVSGEGARLRVPVRVLSRGVKASVGEQRGPVRVLPMVSLQLHVLGGSPLLVPVGQLSTAVLSADTGWVDYRDTLMVDLSGYQGQRFKFRARLHTGKRARLSFVEVYDLRGTGEAVAGPNAPLAVGQEASPVSVPTRLTLLPARPNPFNPSTEIGFGLPAAARVRLVVYDVLGRRIRTLAEGNYPAGWHRVRWDGRDESGREVASGVYLYRLFVLPLLKAGRGMS